MLEFSNAFGIAVSFILAPFRSLPMAGMIVISALTGVLMLVVYRYTSNQTGITLAKNRIKAHFLAIMLFKDSLIVLLKSIGNILLWNLIYMGHNLRPLAVMIFPVLILLVQINSWYGCRPLAVGEATTVDVKVVRDVNLADTPVHLEATSGVGVETSGVRMPGTGEIAWRVRATGPGEHVLTVKVGMATATKRFIVGKADRLYRLSPLRHNGGFWNGLFYPGEKKLNGPITSIKVNYPAIKMNVFGWHIHWIIVYFILSIAAGLSMKGLFGVDI